MLFRMLLFLIIGTFCNALVTYSFRTNKISPCYNVCNIGRSQRQVENVKTSSHSDETIPIQNINGKHLIQTARELSRTMPHHRLTMKTINIIVNDWGDITTTDNIDQSHLQQQQQQQQQSQLQSRRRLLPSSVLNKSNLLQELQESMIVLGKFMDWLDLHSDMNSSEMFEPIILVDVCCGKGIASLLASYLFKDDARVAKIVMMDKLVEEENNNNKKKKNKNKNGLLDWSHIDIANQNCYEERRPFIETRKANLYDTDDTVEWLTSLSSSTTMPGITFQTPPRLAMIGIHLCKNLSPTFVGIVNALGGPRGVPFVCLAPCCLPRVVVQSMKKKNKKRKIENMTNNTTTGNDGNYFLNVAQYERPMQRQARLLAVQRRHNARQRRRQQQQQRQGEQQSKGLSQPDLSTMESYCWKCGEVGHQKKDCTSTQSASLPSLIPQPVMSLDVSHVLQTQNPFETYCHLLSTSFDPQYSVRVLEEKGYSLSTKNEYDDKKSVQNVKKYENNWNRDRKTIFIVAS